MHQTATLIKEESRHFGHSIGRTHFRFLLNGEGLICLPILPQMDQLAGTGTREMAERLLELDRAEMILSEHEALSLCFTIGVLARWARHTSEPEAFVKRHIFANLGTIPANGLLESEGWERAVAVIPASLNCPIHEGVLALCKGIQVGDMLHSLDRVEGHKITLELETF